MCWKCQVWSFRKIPAIQAQMQLEMYFFLQVMCLLLWTNRHETYKVCSTPAKILRYEFLGKSLQCKPRYRWSGCLCISSCWWHESYFVEEEKLHCCQHGMKFESSCFLLVPFSRSCVFQPYGIFAGNGCCTELSAEHANERVHCRGWKNNFL